MRGILSCASIAICLFALSACLNTFTFVKRSTDQKALATIAQNDSDPYVRQEAVKKLADQKVLMRIAQTDSDTVVRQEAVGRIVDQKILEQIAVTNDRPYVQRKAVQKITDQSVLVKIASNVPYTQAGHAAVGRISDQTVLARIVLNESSNPSRESVYFRSRVVRRLTDPTVLKQIAQTDVDKDVRLLAENTLADLQLLNRAAQRLVEGNAAGPDALAQIAQKDPDEKIRSLAINKMADQKGLSQMSQDVSSDDTVSESEQRIPEQAVLAKIAMKDPDQRVRYLAVDQLTDQGALIQIARNEPDQKIRYAVVSKLTDQDALEQTARSDPDEKIRYLAAYTLLELDGAVATSETTPVKMMLLEPEIIEHWGNLDLYIREFWTVQEYSNSATFNKRHLEIKISATKNKIIFHRFYSTRSGAILESFLRNTSGEIASGGGGLVNIDYADICTALLKPFDASGLRIMANSKNTPLREAALRMTGSDRP